MKIKTSELVGDALNYAVALIEYGPRKVYINPDIRRKGIWVVPQKNGGKNHFHPAKSHAQGGYIIEREKISIVNAAGDDVWSAYPVSPSHEVALERRRSGPTHLIAAMRCYVALKLGDEVEIPEELLR